MPVCRTHKVCIRSALVTAEMICRDRGVRFTKLRRRVLELVWAGHGPVKAYEILGKLDNSIAAVRPPTVYRSLDFLLECGLVHKLSSLNAYVGCSHPLKHDECYFLLCSGCGEVKECCSGELEQVIREAAGKNEFRLGHTTLEIEGRCRECRDGGI